MKPFTLIAKPHEDILEGKLTMDVFAADLWQVANQRAPLDYQDPDLFFKKTYLTNGLKNIFAITQARLAGKGGDAVIQLQTPFGGGKTHTLIGLYHKARGWNANVAVFDGTALDPKEVKPWEQLERQLTAKIEITKGDTSPGKEKLTKLLTENSPVLILMDELLEYVTKAAGVKVGDSNLASQTFAFVQELTGAVSTVGNALLVMTLPSSILEHYDENAERLFQQLQKIIGRTEKIYTPVDDEEIAHVVRARLFSKIDEKEAKRIVDEFVEYAKNEALLSGDEAVDYREKFLRSYPFKPEVIDILYKRWGSFPTFQRTRGVLRLLSLVVYHLLDKNVPFIRLGEFNLSSDKTRRELIKHIGQEWDSIIAQDIAAKDAGAKKVDESLGSSYKPYNLGTVASTTIFMTSFSGKGEKEVSLREIKLSSVHPEFSSTVIDTAISNLKEKLFYLSDEGLFFTNQPNLNKMIIAREESIPKEDIYEEEKRLIENHISKQPRFKVHIHPKFHKDIPDTADLKLIILDKEKPERDFLEKHGQSPRVYRNTLIFLCTDMEQKQNFQQYVRKLLALKSIQDDTQLALTEAQKLEVKNKLESYKQREYEELRKVYRKIVLPDKRGYKKTDIGLPTYGESLLDMEIYETLRNQGEILEKISPKVIKDKYLQEKHYVEIKKLYDAFLKTPGELRLVSKEKFKEGIKEGVKTGLMGYGYVSQNGIECQYINETPEIYLTDKEIIINSELCVKEPTQHLPEPVFGTYPQEKTTPSTSEKKPEKYKEKHYSTINLKLNVTIGQISTIAKIANYLNSKFDQCGVEITIHASNGKMNVTEYEDKVKEALIQAHILIKEESKN